MRCSATAFVFLCAFLYGISFSSTDVTIRGTIKDNANNSLSGATAVLLKAGLTATSNSSGEFTITGTIPSIGTKFNGKLQDPSVQKPVYNGSKLLFTIPAQPKRVRIDIFDIKGKLLGTALNERLMGGSYSVSPLGTLKGTASSMLYLVRIRIDTDVATFVIPQVTSARRAYAVISRTFETADLNKFSAGAVDTLDVTLCGYLLSRRPIESYSQTAVAVTMTEGSLRQIIPLDIESFGRRGAANAGASAENRSVRGGTTVRVSFEYHL